MHLSKDGDCILVVSTDKGLPDLSTEFKETLRQHYSKLTIKIEVDDLKETIHAKGSPMLALTDPLEMVVRKSDFTSDRTLGFKADKAAIDISREMAEKLKNPKTRAKITLIAQSRGV